MKNFIILGVFSLALSSFMYGVLDRDFKKVQRYSELMKKAISFERLGQAGLAKACKEEAKKICLTDLDLTKADLTEFNLTDADFCGTDFTSAIMNRVDARGSDFTWAVISGIKLNDARYDIKSFAFALNRKEIFSDDLFTNLGEK